MRSVYERETKYSSPARGGEEVVRTTVTRSRVDRSPISATKREVIEGLSGTKRTTTVFEGPGYVSRTVVERTEEAPREEYTRYERTREEGGEEVRRTTTTRVERDGARPVEEVRRTVVTETSPVAGLKSSTKVVYEGDPSLRASRLERTSEYERTSPSGTYSRTIETRSPYRSSATKRVYETVREEGEGGSGYKREVYRREVSPDRTVITRTVRESPPAKQEEEVEEKIETPVERERTTYTRTVRETSPLRTGVTTTRVVRDSPNYKETTYSRSYRAESPGRTYTRTVVDNGPEKRTTITTIEEPEMEEEPKAVQKSERKVEEVPTKTSSSRKEITTVTTGPVEDYPVRRRPADSEEDVVVLRYTSPYRK